MDQQTPQTPPVPYGQDTSASAEPLINGRPASEVIGSIPAQAPDVSAATAPAPAPVPTQAPVQTQATGVPNQAPAAAQAPTPPASPYAAQMPNPAYPNQAPGISNPGQAPTNTPPAQQTVYSGPNSGPYGYPVNTNGAILTPPTGIPGRAPLRVQQGHPVLYPNLIYIGIGVVLFFIYAFVPFDYDTSEALVNLIAGMMVAGPIFTIATVVINRIRNR